MTYFPACVLDSPLFQHEHNSQISSETASATALEELLRGNGFATQPHATHEQHGVVLSEEDVVANGHVR